jgi:hypothetical protein
MPWHIDERKLLKSLSVAKIHEKTFSPYKNMYNGKEIAIIATGPSLNDYAPIEGVINIGLNKAFLHDKIELDYLFMQDYGVKEYIDKLDDPKYKDITKFFGMAPETYFDYPHYNLKNKIIPESVILKFNARQYFQYCTLSISSINFSKDIDCNYLECGGSVALAAMQFALYTNPKRIYLVGCDCSSGYYDDKDAQKISKNAAYIKSWSKLKKFAELYYPETEIISVNPYGLKGMFEEIRINDVKK